MKLLKHYYKIAEDIADLALNTNQSLWTHELLIEPLGYKNIYNFQHENKEVN
jgi:hypothetical protein